MSCLQILIREKEEQGSMTIKLDFENAPMIFYIALIMERITSVHFSIIINGQTPFKKVILSTLLIYSLYGTFN